MSVFLPNCSGHNCLFFARFLTGEDMKKMIVAGVCLGLLGCATQQGTAVATQGHKFATGKPVEVVVGAIVATLQEENLSVTTINEKYGIVSTGTQDIPAATVSKWRSDPAFGLGSTTWKVDINFNVTPSGDVTVKYCHQGNNPWSGIKECLPYKAENAARYFQQKIVSKL